MPDLNSLDTSSSPSTRNGEGTPSSSSPSPRSASVSLQAAATLNAGLRGSSSSSVPRQRQSPSASRRRSQVMMNVQSPSSGETMADASPRVFPTSPSMATADPHHSRTPSMGELHQTLESENEFHVNRLLQEIRLLQGQLAQRPPANNQAVGSGDDSSERSAHAVRSPVPPPRSSFDMARADLQRRSRTPSHGASPRMRSTSFSAETAEPWTLAGRDESAFYQAETQMLLRENRMLRHRIRELERQLTDESTHEPSQPSHLGRSTSSTEHEARIAAHPSAPPPMPTVSDAPKEA